MYKKAMTPSIIIFLFIVAGFISFSIVRSDSFSVFNSEFPGELALAILDSSGEAEYLQHFVDQSADLSGRQALYELGERGGFNTLSHCGNLYGYNLRGLQSSCQPNAYHSFLKLFSNHFEHYLELHPSFDTFTYDYTAVQILDEFQIIGTPLQTLTIPIIMDNKELEDSFQIYRPDFSRFFPINFLDITTLNSESLKAVETCSQAGSLPEIDRCLGQQGITPSNWESVKPQLDAEDLFESFVTFDALVKASKREKCIQQLHLPEDGLQKITLSKEGEVLQLLSRGDLIRSYPFTSLQRFGDGSEDNYDFTLHFDDGVASWEREGDGLDEELGTALMFFKKDDRTYLLPQSIFQENPSTFSSELCFQTRFYTLDTGAEFYTYDRKTDTVAMRPITIDFGVLLEDFNSMDLNNLDVFSQQE